MCISSACETPRPSRKRSGKASVRASWAAVIVSGLRARIWAIPVAIVIWLVAASARLAVTSTSRPLTSPVHRVG